MNPRAFVITVRSAQAGRLEREEQHLKERGIVAERFYGIDANISGLETRWLYEIDNPGTGFKIGSKLVCLIFSHYLLYRVLEQLPDDHFWILEDDAQFDPDWEIRYRTATNHLPKDWDLLWMGSCCTNDKPSTPMGGGLYEVHWPLCTHAYAVNKKALPILSSALERIYAPLDVALAFHAMPRLRTFTILPRIASQFQTFLPT